MTDATLSPPPDRNRFLAGPTESEAAADSAYAAAALETHKRQGLELAVRARWVTMGVTAIFLVYVNPTWSVLYYHVVLALLCLNGWLMQRVGRVGQSRVELLLLFLDLLIMTVAMVMPSPFGPENHPAAMQYRFDNFQYFFIILAVGTMAYSWRTVIAIGTWTAGMWSVGLVMSWWLSEPVAGLSEATAVAFAGHPDLIDDLDPNNFHFTLRAQEILVFLLVAVTLGISARRFNLLVLNNAGLERERANLSRYFSPNVVAELSHNDEPLKQIRSQNIAVMFVDIVGFTELANRSDPYAVVDLLRGFHGRMEREVFRHHGTLDKYLGDGLMATFGTPLAGKTDATNALQCARAMVEAMDVWNRDRKRAGEPEIHAGIGLHFGEVVLGDIGANRLEFAVIGTSVNVASRLEALTRPLQSRVVVSDAMRQRIEEEGEATGLFDDLTRHSDQTIRGIAEKMTVWSL